MIEIKDLLLGFEHLLIKGEIQNKIILDAIEKTTNLKIKKEDIKIKNGVVYLNIKPIYKNEIFIKRDIIISILERSFGQKSPKDIR